MIVLLFGIDDTRQQCHRPVATDNQVACLTTFPIRHTKRSAGGSGRCFPLLSSSVMALPSRQIEQQTASVSQEASHLLVRTTRRLAQFCRLLRGEADQGFHLRVRSSSTTPCLNASSSALSKSLAGFAGEVSRHQMASHFPSLPIVLLAVFTAHGRLWGISSGKQESEKELSASRAVGQ